MFIRKGLFVLLGFSFSTVFAGSMALITAYHDFGSLYADAQTRLLNLINESPATKAPTRSGIPSIHDNPGNISEQPLLFKSDIGYAALVNRYYPAGKNSRSFRSIYSQLAEYFASFTINLNKPIYHIDAELADEMMPHRLSEIQANTSSLTETEHPYPNLRDYFALTQRFNSIVYRNNDRLMLELNSQAQCQSMLKSDGFNRDLSSTSAATPRSIIYHIVSKNEKNQIISLMAGVSYSF